ncbi:putative membrane protein [Desulfosporosinus acidiphilus SJ4]|uniref:Putative membrane protein n=1 Tax=Desulfosporosinus acidiphilus (strain DSM 22704 / JCM 16185 / SJ4) TaxID=646529 RepID=I4D9W8_DESAJ|nr:YihY/virulence factor BrkB family protein [Desulfosporosinus acidiphilus]AFM42592.1 putative membrane protein [Desulfosporosinus acidiphilus SJ4]
MILWRRILAFIRSLLKSIMEHNIAALAAAIAFFGFSSMIPLLLLLIYGASIFIPQETVQNFISAVFQSYVPALPDAKIYLSQNVSRLVLLGSNKVGLFGILGLLWTTVGGFVSFQRILDTIWNVHERRSFLKQYLVGFGMLMVLVSLTVVSSLATIVSVALVKNFLTPQQSIPLWLAFFHGISHLSFPLLLFLTCLFCYRFLPSQTISYFYLFLGALISTLGIYLSRVAFVWYTANLGQYEMIYGSLTFIMLFTFWAYISCIIVLFGAEVAVTLNKLKDADKEFR